MSVEKGLVARARVFAEHAHAGQARRYTGEPFVAHPIRVATAVALLTEDAEIIAAAYLHDVLEDTAVTHAKLGEMFGARVAAIVAELTSVYTHERYPQLNRARRKALERQRLASASDAARLIKRPDVLDNLRSIEQHDPAFAPTYRAEAEALLDLLDSEEPARHPTVPTLEWVGRAEQ